MVLLNRYFCVVLSNYIMKPGTHKDYLTLLWRESQTTHKYYFCYSFILRASIRQKVITEFGDEFSEYIWVETTSYRARFLCLL